MTAVEWLFLMLNNPNRNQDFANKLLDKAKEMEKEQVIDTAKYYFHERGKLTPEQYYNETFKSE